MNNTTQNAEKVTAKTNTEVVSTREYKFLRVVSVKKVDTEGKEHYYSNVYINGILVVAFDKRKQKDLAIFVKTICDVNKD